MEESKDFKLEFGLMIREKRCMAGWTQQQLSKKLGVVPSFVSMIEHGKEVVPIHIVGKIARILRMDRRAILLMLNDAYMKKIEEDFNNGYNEAKPYTNFGKTLHP